MTALLVIIIFVALIVVHELGHFVVAKLTRVRVEEFGIGYPPRALSLGTWGGTEYTINWKYVFQYPGPLPRLVFPNVYIG